MKSSHERYSRRAIVLVTAFSLSAVCFPFFVCLPLCTDYRVRPCGLHSRGWTDKSGTGMTEIMPVPRNSHITVLRPPSIMRSLFLSSRMIYHFIFVSFKSHTYNLIPTGFLYMFLHSSDEIIVSLYLKLFLKNIFSVLLKNHTVSNQNNPHFYLLKFLDLQLLLIYVLFL